MRHMLKELRNTMQGNSKRNQKYFKAKKGQVKTVKEEQDLKSDNSENEED